MANRSMFDTPALPRLSTILEELREGTVLVPAFQRDFLWGNDKRLKLMDSVYRGLPIGTLMVWRTRKINAGDGSQDLRVRTHLGIAAVGAPPEDSHSRTYLIDGLQRMSTLYSALTATTDESKVAVESREINWPIYFDLNPEPAARDDIRFKLLPRGREQPKTWMPMSITFDDARIYALKDELIKNGLSALTSEVEQVISRFKDYIIPVIPLVTDELDLVTETFARVNHQGTTMGEVDMTRALTYRKDFDINDILDQIRAGLADRGWGSLRRQHLLNILKAVWDIPIYKAKPEAVGKKLKEQPEALAGLDGWFRDAFDLLEMLGIFGQAALPYLYQLAGLVRAAQRHGRTALLAAAPRLHRWVFQTAYAEHFSGMTYAQLAEAFEHVETLVIDATVDPTPPGMQNEVRPLGRFRVGAVRSTLFALSMAREGDRAGKSSGAHQALQRDFGQHGTTNKLLPAEGADRTGLFVIAANDELAMLRQIMREPESIGISFLEDMLRPLSGESPSAIAANDPLCLKHIFTEEGLRRLRLDDFEAFALVRERELQEIERRFVEQLGMTWREDDESI